MPKQVTMGASLLCSQGAASSKLIVLPINRVIADGMPAANVMDMIPIVNIPPFGVCRSLANPQVAAATASAMGVLTPMPCIPVITGPWKPGSKKVKIANQSALNDRSKCMCMWGGNIQIMKPGSKKVDIG